MGGIFDSLVWQQESDVEFCDLDGRGNKRVLLISSIGVLHCLPWDSFYYIPGEQWYLGIYKSV